MPELNSHAVASLYQEQTKRQPKDAELFLHEGSLWIFRAKKRTWESLGMQEDPAGFEGTGAMEYELQEGILVRGSPAFVLSLVMRAYFEANEDRSTDFVKFVYKIFKQCGWTGPAETDVSARPGTVAFVSKGPSLSKVTNMRKVADLRPIYSQLQDPELNGWVYVECEEGKSFINVQTVDRIEIVEDK